MSLKHRFRAVAILALAGGVSGCTCFNAADRAERQLRNGDDEKALRTAAAAIADDPESADNWRIRGIIHQCRGERPEAEADLLTAAGLREDYRTYCLLARLYGEMGDYAAMDLCFESAIALAPERGEAYAARGIFQLLARNRREEAEADLRRAAAAGAQNSVAAPLARILWLRGDYAAAKKLLTRPDAGAPEQLEYAWMLAAAPEPEERDPRKARLLASRLAVALPYPNVFSVLAQSYAAESDWRGAAQAMSEAEKLLDDQPAERYDRDYYRAFLAMQRRFYRDRRQDAAPELAGRQLFLIEYR